MWVKGPSQIKTHGYQRLGLLLGIICKGDTILDGQIGSMLGFIARLHMLVRDPTLMAHPQSDLCLCRLQLNWAQN